MTRILGLSLLLIGVLLTGTLGYRFVLGWDWLEALYMTTITITTVGFGEVRHLDTGGRILTILLIVTSVGVFAYAVTTLGSLVVEMQVGSVIWRRRMDKRIAALRGHYIVCGYGRTGRAVGISLLQAGTSCVVVERESGNLDLLKQDDMLFVEGDATFDECLERAGVKQAKGLVAALGNDAENVYLVLSARQSSPHLTIVSWATSEEAERKVLRAGANHALSPYTMGGRRIANLLTAPHALEFLDHAMGGKDNIRLGEIEIKPGSPLIGSSFVTAGIRRDVGVIVIGIRRISGKLEFNPAADEILHEHDILIGIGSEEQIDKLRGLL